MKKIFLTLGILFMLSGLSYAQMGLTFYGVNALNNNTTGDWNNAFGEISLFSNTAGNHNSAFGYRTLFSNTSGSYNSAFGNHALHNNTTGYRNTATGNKSLYFNSSGSYNTACGFETLYSNTTSRYNSAFGYKALRLNTTGLKNTAIGAYALSANISGNYNNAFGYDSLYSNTVGYSNSAIGNYSMYENTTGHGNSAMGYLAMRYNTAGDYNTAVGYSAGPGSTYTNLFNSTALGYASRTTADNQVRIGNTMITSIGGYVGWSNVSDDRFKRNVSEDVLGLEFIMQLKPVSYEMDRQVFDDFIGVKKSDVTLVDNPDKVDARTGFIAQEVEELVNELGFDYFSGVDAPDNDQDYYSLRYAEFVVPLVKAVQEQQEQIEEQQKQIDELVAKINELLSR